MSHEIRTPLNGVLGMADLILTANLPGDQRENLELIKRSGKSLLTLLTDILDFSRIEAGRLPLDVAPFSIRGCAESARAMLSAQATQKSLKLTVSVAADVPDALLGDATRLRQVL